MAAVSLSLQGTGRSGRACACRSTTLSTRRRIIRSPAAAAIAAFFLRAATTLRNHSFLLGGAGWHDKLVPANVRCTGHVLTADHNAFFASALATLNVNRESMARCGFSPPTRIFEAAGAGACLITDAWDGIEQFLEPDREVLVAADGERSEERRVGKE